MAFLLPLPVFLSPSRRAVATSNSIPTSQWQSVVYIPSDGNASSGVWSNPESNMDSTSTKLVTIKSLLNGMVINYEPQDNLLIRYKVKKGTQTVDRQIPHK